MKQPLSDSWMSVIGDYFDSEGMKTIKSFLVKALKKGPVYPASKDMFAALLASEFDDVKVVILGQDPYHGEGQAHGYCFSVKPGIRVPPSLINIFKEIEDDLNIKRGDNGDLRPWAQQGVLLLNAVLTVQAGLAQSHQGQGWEDFTDRVIHELNTRREHLVFMLWGSSAQKKAEKIDEERHLVLKAPHPSPLSAHRGFLGCKHFSLCNFYLESHGLPVIDWSLD
jgi:uracil-DNA glycosylase